MYAVRLWSVRHAGFWEWFYRHFERAYVAAGPSLQRIGLQRLEAPAALIERQVKGLLFDCQMCGKCVLSSTGMSCRPAKYRMKPKPQWYHRNTAATVGNAVPGSSRGSWRTLPTLRTAGPGG